MFINVNKNVTLITERHNVLIKSTASGYSFL